jgi:tetratricopeptide (TPR) repeat protein
MRNGRRAPATARATLAYFYAREKQFARSRALLQELSALYPRNHVFAMEAAMSHAREENYAAAAAAYEEIARKFKARAPGFTRLSAPRLYFQTAVMYERAKNFPRAASGYEETLAALAPPSPSPAASANASSSDKAANPLLAVMPSAGSSRSAASSRPTANRVASADDPAKPPSARTLPAPSAEYPTVPADWSSPLARLRAHTLLRLGSILATLGDKTKARLHLGQAASAPFREVSREASRRLKDL